jgi:hypothetical protein
MGNRPMHGHGASLASHQGRWHARKTRITSAATA